jgi:predicted patatin/cPLA2 family phospholipase
MAYEHLILSGGGVKGLIHIGVIKYLVSRNIINLEKLKSISGTSIGSFIGLMLVLKIPINEIENVMRMDTMNMFKINLLQFFTDHEIVDSSIIRTLIKDIVRKAEKKHKVSLRTMEDLFFFNPVEFNISVTSIDDRCNMIINAVNHPSLSIVDSIMASTAVPVLFRPVRLYDKYFLDGGLTNNCPIPKWLDIKDKSIAINHMSEYNTVLPKEFTSTEYVKTLFDLICSIYFTAQKDNFLLDINEYNVQLIVSQPSDKFTIFVLEITSEDKDELVQEGINCATRWYNSIIATTSN